MLASEVGLSSTELLFWKNVLVFYIFLLQKGMSRGNQTLKKKKKREIRLYD
jgi:hypothetical protein